MTFHIVSKLMAMLAMSLFISTAAVAQDSPSEGEPSDDEKSIVSAAKREIHKHAVGLGLGQTFLFGDLEDKGDNQITGDLFYSYTASYSFDLLANLHSSHHSYKDNDVWLRGLVFSIKGRSHEFDAFSPFVLAGLGFYQPRIQKGDAKSEIKNTFGFNAGAGVDLRLNRRVVVGIIGQYHNPFDVKQDDIEDIEGSYFKLLLTGMYLF